MSSLAACNCGLQPVQDCNGVPCSTGGGAAGGGRQTGGGGSSAGGSAAGGGSATGGGSTGGGATGGGASGGGGATGGGSGVQCSGLSLSACRQQAGCVADMCFACSCSPTFKGCRGINEAALECPGLGCPQPTCCANDGACATISGALCVAPSRLSCGGVCAPGGCQTDADCQTSGIGPLCDPNPCGCPAKVCTGRCGVNNPCKAYGQTCDSTSGRCLAINCSTGVICPDGSTCSGGFCVPQTCTTDRDCSAGACFNQQCSPTLGQCRLPQP